MPLISVNIETLGAAILFACIFFFGARLRLSRPGHHRRAMSFAAGVAVAYVFIHLLPELQSAKEVFIKTTAHLSLPLQEHQVYLAAMAGFILFYGLENMWAWARPKAGQESSGYWIHISGFAVYAWLVGYLLIRNIDEQTVSIALYTVAMGLHFLAVDHELRREHRETYARSGKNILALAALAGWGVGVFTEISKPMVVILLGFISGAVIVNSMIMELPKEKEGRFLPFLLGGVFYTILLILLG